MPTRKILTALALALALLAGSRARAEDDPKALAKQHFAAGEAKFKAGDYRGAIAEFEAADALVPSAILSYNIGLCHEKLGAREAAVAEFRRYLARRPDAPNKAQVEARIARLEQEIEAAKAPPPPPPEEKPKSPEQPTLGPGSKGGWVDPDPRKEPPPADTPPAGGDTLDEGDPSAMEGGPGPASGADPLLAKRIPSRKVAARDAAAPAPAPGPAEPAPAPAVPDKPQPKKVKPLYKEWWFWVVAGVSAVILVSMFDDNSNSTAPQPGMILVRF